MVHIVGREIWISGAKLDVPVMTMLNELERPIVKGKFDNPSISKIPELPYKTNLNFFNR